MIRIGPAGWSYEDWQGIVYPARARFDQLSYLAGFFDTIEINSTFYRPAGVKMAESWARRVLFNPNFRFTVKLWQKLTHEREALDPTQVREWTAGVSPLQEAGRLGAVLIQFPWSFKHCPESRERLAKLVEALRDLPLVVEFRHASWDNDVVLEFLRELHAGICNIDQPVIGRSIRPKSHVTSAVAYFRLHGRNYRDWFREDAGRDARYNYLYTVKETEEQADLVSQLEEQAQDVYVVYNNHYRGQAVVNALQLRRRLTHQLVSAPEPLIAAYPQLRDIVRPDSAAHLPHSTDHVG